MELIDFIGAEQPRKAKRLFYNGVKFRSICAKCNNELLGARYDPELVRFTKEISVNFHSRVYAPIDTTLRLNRIARSAVGHLLAHGINMHRTGEVTDQLTDFFLDESATFPSDLSLYCWLYPYNDQIVINGAAALFDYRHQNGPLFYMLLKFFPISFLVTKGHVPPQVPYSIVRLDQLLSSSIDASTSLSVPVSAIPPKRWPEAPGEYGVVMHSKGATAATRVAP